MKNLDLISQQYAQKIVENAVKELGSGAKAATSVENMVTKTLGVVQEAGIYAGMLFLLTRKGQDEKVAREMRGQLLQLTQVLLPPGTNIDGVRDSRQSVSFLTQHVCQDLDRLLLVKQVWEQTLIYARYGAKAEGATN